jgi:hypothetical protein
MLKNMLDAEGKELKDDNKSNFKRSKGGTRIQS